MYCRRCGKQIDDGTAYCPHCGEPQATGAARPQPQYQQQAVYDSGSFGWAILGFLIPLAGLILWLAWIDVKPKSAKMAGIGALVSVILSIVFTILAIVLVIALGDFETVESFLI